MCTNLLNRSWSLPSPERLRAGRLLECVAQAGSWEREELFDSSLDDQFYEDIAWGGLLETDTFKNTNSLSETDKTGIINMNYNEDLGNNDAKSDKCGS